MHTAVQTDIIWFIILVEFKIKPCYLFYNINDCFDIYLALINANKVSVLLAFQETVFNFTPFPLRLA